jgi:hypothetical protein
MMEVNLVHGDTYPASRQARAGKSLDLQRMVVTTPGTTISTLTRQRHYIAYTDLGICPFAGCGPNLDLVGQEFLGTLAEHVL